MGNDIFWTAVIIVNLGGFLFQTEPPLWVYNLIKWSAIRYQFNFGGSFIANKFSLIAFLLIYAMATYNDGRFLGFVFSFILLGYTLLSLFKIVNAVLPPQKEIHTIAKIVDVAIFQRDNEYAFSEFVYIRAMTLDLGVRVLPAYKYSSEMRAALRPGNSIPLICRMGCLGRLYRLSFLLP